MPRAVFVSQDTYLAQIEHLKKARMVLAAPVVGHDASATWNQSTTGYSLPEHKLQASGGSGWSSDSTRVQSQDSSRTPTVDSAQQDFGDQDDDWETADWSSQRYSMEVVLKGNHMVEGRNTTTKNRKSNDDSVRAYRDQVRDRNVVAEEHVFSQGTYCMARRHLRLGCAVITFSSADMKAKVLEHAGKMSTSETPTWSVGPVVASLQPHRDSATKSIDECSIFAFWGRQVEKKVVKLPVPMISAAFDRLCEQALRNM